MGHYARVDYNLTLRPLQSRLQHIYHGQPYAKVDFIPQSGTLDLASVPYARVDFIPQPGTLDLASPLYKSAKSWKVLTI